MNKPELWEKLRSVLRRDAMSFGQVPLSSGKVSTYYIDGKMVTLAPEGAYLVASLMLDRIGVDADAVGGLTIGADPIVGAIAAVSHLEGRPINTFIVRKEPKKHGKMKWIEGPVREGDRVVIVDDVITTGGSLIKAIEAAEEAGCKVVKVIALVDRQEGGRETLTQMGYAFEALFTSSDLTVERSQASRANTEAA